MTDLSIITVTHQSALFIEDLIVSVISGAIKLTTEHFIVDNASSDGTAELIERNYLSFVTLIKNEHNVGFSKANNQAFAHVKGRYVLFLNPDMKVKSGSLDHIVEWMDTQPDVGIATCKLVDPLGQLLIHRTPFGFPRFGRNVFWLALPGYCLDRPLWFSNEIKQVEVVLGAFMLTRRSFLDSLGFAFDPRYFLTFEDIDLCREAKRLEYKVMYYPLVSCVDYNSRSFFQKNFFWIYRQVSKGMYLYFRKWEPWYTSVCIALLTPVGYLMRYLLTKKKKT